MPEFSAEYLDGAEAYRQGLTDADNPHPIGSEEAMDWFDGWNNESTASKE